MNEQIDSASEFIDPLEMYKTIRQEILDQKKCQFHLFSITITVTAAILAYASASPIGPIVYIAPMVMNVLALTIILDKATSIQRMVGYLQLMEVRKRDIKWMWEYHLNKFRAVRTRKGASDSFRKHTYIVTVSSMLMFLNLLCGVLYRWGPIATSLREKEGFIKLARFYGSMDVIAIIIILSGIIYSVFKWYHLVFGKFSSDSIKIRWEKVFEETGSIL